MFIVVVAYASIVYNRKHLEENSPFTAIFDEGAECIHSFRIVVLRYR